MKIVVFGAGALGSFIGAYLSKKYDVTLIARKGHVDAINSRGLLVQGKSNFVAKPKAYEDISSIKNVDLIILTVKSYDTYKAMKILSKIIKKDTFVMSFQNGLGNAETISKFAHKVVGGVTSHGITFVDNGIIYHAGIGDTIMGNFCNVDEKELREICYLCNSVGIKTKISKNIVGEIWAKAIVNVGINPLTAITRLPNGYIVRIEELEKIMEGACREAIDVAKVCGIKLPNYNLIEKTKKVALLTSENRSSMLQDIERRRRTEIEMINGAIVKLGNKYGINTPINSILVALVKAIEKSYL